MDIQDNRPICRTGQSGKPGSVYALDLSLCDPVTRSKGGQSCQGGPVQTCHRDPALNKLGGLESGV